jgi:hypothetical protein
MENQSQTRKCPYDWRKCPIMMEYMKSLPECKVAQVRCPYIAKAASSPESVKNCPYFNKEK